MEQDKQIYDKAEVGSRIRKRRESLGISRHSMAVQIGRAEKYYADIERGYCGMSLETLIEIALCLGTTLDYLVFGIKREDNQPEEIRNILCYLEQCSEDRQKKARELLQLYLMN